MRWFKGFFTCLLVAVMITGNAQDKYYYVYIQSDGGQLFYIRENGRLLSSSSAGYVIIPQLLAGKNQIIIGFPRNEFPEQKFDIDINNIDKGYLLKQNGSQEFVLYNLVNYAMLKPVAISQGPSFAYQNSSSSVSKPSPTDVHSDETPDTTGRRLQFAKPAAVKDTTPQIDKNVLRFRKLLEAAVNEGKPETTSPVPVNSSTQKDTTTTNTLSALNESKEVDTSTSKVNQVFASRAQDHSNLVKANKNAEQNPDTTMSLITGKTPVSTEYDSTATPAFSINNKQDTSQSSFSVPKQSVPANTDTMQTSAANPAITQNTANKSQLKFINFSNQGSANLVANVNQQSNQNSPVNPPVMNNQNADETTTTVGRITNNNTSSNNVKMINSDCRNLISEDDFQKLRRKVVLQNNDAARLRMVEKFIRDNCFSSNQVETLAYLFTTEEYRFRMVETIYPHVYDSDHFSKLINIFSGDVYRAKFNALLK
jgi:Domain of unknown function (DUF4476)